MKRALGAAAAVACALVASTAASAAGWTTSVAFTNQVASAPAAGGGYPVPAGATAPEPGTCRPGQYNSNRSESWIAVNPGTEDSVGVSKFFFENYSTFYNFHLGSYTIPGGTPGANTQIPGYDCVSTGTQDMPPSWTNNTDPNVAFDTRGRAYQVTLPFNAYWANFHPNGAIGAVYSDNLGASWTVANGGKLIELLNNQSSFAVGGFQDKQWVAVNHVATSPNRDHVYAMWAVFNGNAVKIHESVSRDRGATFSKPISITAPSQTGPSTTYVYPSIDAAGVLYVAIAAFDQFHGSTDADVYVTKSVDDGATFGPWVKVARATGNPGNFANGNFRDGILESFAASETYPGHLYVTYENWRGTQMDVMFSQSKDGGLTWTEPVQVNDASNSATTDQFQPSVAAGPGGAVAVAFYDRRGDCPSDPSIDPANVGAANTCVDVSLQAYKETGMADYASPVGANVRITQFSYDPSQPRQRVGGLGQQACASHSDPCRTVFLGDYFGLAVSAGNVYGLFVSTHYPSPVVSADGGGPVYYQQQVLATVPRLGLGL
jgi:hypothetical protein